MTYILSIETATPNCSIALHQEGELIGELTICKGQSHSSLLNEAIQKLCLLVGIDHKNLNAVAISKGPGSYTGLRIGTSTAKGLCYALDLPLISVNTLEAMAFGMINVNGWKLCPMLDARRMEVYYSIFSKEIEMIAPTSPVVLSTDTFSSSLVKNFPSKNSTSFQTSRRKQNKHETIFVNNIFPRAANIGKLAFDKFQEKDFENTAYFEPYYLKDFMVTKPKSIL